MHMRARIEKWMKGQLSVHTLSFLSSQQHATHAQHTTCVHPFRCKPLLFITSTTTTKLKLAAPLLAITNALACCIWLSGQGCCAKPG
uniref:Putative secreted protein n=1 Tax=Anopheles triannulatus TaxID=58253 RepID=A0A2M4B7G8_9DIPT